MGARSSKFDTVRAAVNGLYVCIPCTASHVHVIATQLYGNLKTPKHEGSSRTSAAKLDHALLECSYSLVPRLHI